MSPNPSRRTFISASAATFAVLKPEQLRSAAGAKLKAGIVGCGGRGTQAVVNLLSGNPDVELVAMGDVFEDKLEASLKRLRDPGYVGNGVKQVADFTKKPAAELI